MFSAILVFSMTALVRRRFRRYEPVNEHNSDLYQVVRV